MGIGKDDHVVLEQKSFIDFELGDSAKDEANEEESSLTEKKQIIDAIGSWGRWQMQRFSLVILIIWLPTSFHLLNMIFYRAETDYWCSRPEKFANWSIESWRELSSPGWNSTDDSIKNNASCSILDLDYAKIDPHTGENADFSQLHSAQSKRIPCTSWEYDTSFWRRTIIMDFDLVCSRFWLQKLQQQVTFLGLMLGVSLAGFISDRFGRKKTMVILLTAIILSGIANRFAPNYPTFLIGVFLCAFMSLAYGTVMYVWMMEHCDGQIKTVLGACPHFNFGFWGLMTALIAYLVPDWRDMQLIFSVPLVLLYSAYWVFPESSRWLLANERVEEAEDIVREIARTNGRVLPAQWRLLPPSKSSCSEGGSATSFFRLFTMPNMRKKTFICYYLWFSTALIYYGLTLNSNTLGTNLFTTFTIGKALEFPSISLVIFLLIKAGRRLTLILFYTLAGVSLTGTIFIPLNVFPFEWPILVMNILGRISAINTLAVCYIYSAEVFPTVVRNIGLGSSSFWARVGPMIAPFIVDLKKEYGAQVPLAIFGVISLLAALLVTFMPETSNTPLPDTIKEGEQLGKGDTFWRSICTSLRRRRRKDTSE